MKSSKFAVVGLALVLSAAVSAQRISHSINNTTITPLNSVACGSNTAPFFTDNNHYWRSYTLAAFGVASPMDILSVTFGVEAATSPAGMQPYTIRLYTDPTPGNPSPTAGLIQLTSQSFMLADATVSGPRIETALLTTPVTVNPTDTIVVELDFPTGSAANLVTFYIGSNNLGETDPSYLSATGCGIAQPTPVSAIGFANMHMILDLDLGPPFSSAAFPGTGEDLIMQSAINTGPFVTGIGNDVRSANAIDLITLRCLSPVGTFNFNQLLLVGQVFITGVPPTSPFPGIAVGQAGAFLLAGGGSTPVGFILLPPGGFTVTVQIPPVLGGAGVSALFQYIVPSQIAANFIFASADGHEFQIQ